MPLDKGIYNVYTGIMNSAVINIKTEPATKKQAQDVAREMGLSLSSIINAYLKRLVRTKKIEIDLQEKPSKYLINAMRHAEKDLKEGKASPTFDNAEDAIKWLNDPKAKYQNGDRV